MKVSKAFDTQFHVNELENKPKSAPNVILFLKMYKYIKSINCKEI